MDRYKKNIKSNHRPEIERIKGHIRNAKNGFDGCGYAFFKAIEELRKEGIKIIYSRETYTYVKVTDQTPG